MVFHSEDSLESFMPTTTTRQMIREKYEKRKKVGEGTYAVVFEGFCKPCAKYPEGCPVAIKKIKMMSNGSVGGAGSSTGFDISAIREIKYLQELRGHPNIIELMDVFAYKANIHLVLEFLHSDLEDIIRDKELIISPGDIKSWLLMTLRGLEHCHKHWILHRDLKPNNLLLSSSGVLKIADFGLAREYGLPSGKMTTQVQTRWYRCPELLLGAKDYSSAVDIWSVACIFAEVMLRVPFIAGDNDMEQLSKIFQALGTPTEAQWPECKYLPGYMGFPSFQRVPFSQFFSAASHDAIELLEAMFQFNPNARISAHDALLHRYFREMPRPTVPEKLPIPRKKEVRAFQPLADNNENGHDAAVAMKPKNLFPQAESDAMAVDQRDGLQFPSAPFDNDASSDDDSDVF